MKKEQRGPSFFGACEGTSGQASVGGELCHAVGPYGVDAHDAWQQTRRRVAGSIGRPEKWNDHHINRPTRGFLSSGIPFGSFAFSVAAELLPAGSLKETSI